MAKLTLADSTTGVSVLYQNPPGPVALVVPVIAGEVTASGKGLYYLSSGKVGIADASASGKHQFMGLAVEAKGVGQAVSMIMNGHVAGYDLSGLAFGALVYLDTTGDLADAANGTTTIAVGKVVGLGQQEADGSVRKALYLWPQHGAAY